MSLLWILATIGIGLLIAVVYLGTRIVTAHLHAKPPSIAKAVIEPVPVQTVPIPIAVQAAQNPESSPPLIRPLKGERYIQIGALNLEAARRFMRHLSGEHLEPRLAPGPNPQLMRVLLGPFDNRDALAERQAYLQEQGIDNFVRKY